MKKSIKINLIVKIIAGKDKGLSGAVIKIDGDYVKVSGLKLQKKSVKKDNGVNENFINVEQWIHVSNICLTVEEKNLTNKKNKNS